MAPAAVFVSEDGERTLKRVSHRIVVEELTGGRAVEYLKGRRAEKPERYGLMGSALARQGYKPTKEVFVYRTLRLVGDISKGNWKDFVTEPTGLRFAETLTSEEGEVIFWSWDDGYDGTWEGSTHVERYSDGAFANYDGQTNIETQDYYEVWTEQTSSGGGDGGEGDCPESDPDCPLMMTSNQPGSRVVPALFSGPSRSPLSRNLVAPRLVQFGWDWGEFLACSAGGCATCYSECWWTGPLWPKCTGYCCAAFIVGCAIMQLL